MLSNKNKTALAVFVKTPELSAVKTRLGQTIGQKQAKNFYELSVKKIRSELSLLKKSKLGDSIDIFWSVAESFTPLHALKWSDHKRIHQKGDNLGEKIHSVYSSLIEQGYSRVILLGGDSPQLTHLDYFGWIERPLFKKEALIGPATDGGFYTFVCGADISKELWSNVSYSQSSTSIELSEALTREKYLVSYLPETFDVDYKDDLDKLLDSLSIKQSPAGVTLQKFINELKL